MSSNSKSSLIRTERFDLTSIESTESVLFTVDVSLSVHGIMVRVYDVSTWGVLKDQRACTPFGKERRQSSTFDTETSNGFSSFQPPEFEREARVAYS